MTVVVPCRRWGYLSRAGVNDKSHLARQMEIYADLYTSRVSNLYSKTPFQYFRSPTQSLAHDRHEASQQAEQSGTANGTAGNGNMPNGMPNGRSLEHSFDSVALDEAAAEFDAGLW
eukprot:4598214-Pyramimonas_sp.AAC.1